MLRKGGGGKKGKKKIYKRRTSEKVKVEGKEAVKKKNRQERIAKGKKKNE